LVKAGQPGWGVCAYRGTGLPGAGGA